MYSFKTARACPDALALQPSVVYYQAQCVFEAKTHLTVPSDKRVPFGWPAVAVTNNNTDEPTVLRWEHISDFSEPTRLRITVALDVREEKRIEVRTTQSNLLLGVFDIRFSSVCQTYEILLEASEANLALQEGVRLQMTLGESPLWLFERDPTVPSVFTPHLLGPTTGDRWSQFDAKICTRDTLQTFGWIAGCVLDGLLQMANLTNNSLAREALDTHLRYFLTRDGDLHYEDPNSVPRHNTIYGMEGLLPFAVIAQVEPKNPILKIALQAAITRLDAAHAVIDHGCTTTEGAYIAGYPLAVMARLWNRSDLAQLALTQLRVRQARNVVGDTIYQAVTGDSQAYLPNWARGVAWYLLGFARVLDLLKPTPDIAGDLYTEFRRAAMWVQMFQRTDGLWGNFLDDVHSKVDTSGSAGIGTALALGAARGWLPPEAGHAAWRTLCGLESHLTPDGFLGGMAQFNKGGEALQRYDYRVIAPMAMGLAAQLRAQIYAEEE